MAYEIRISDWSSDVCFSDLVEIVVLRRAEDALGQVAGEDRRDQRTGIDAHVEQGETSVAARIALRVKLAHHRGTIRLEPAVAANDCGQPLHEDLLLWHQPSAQASRHHPSPQQYGRESCREREIWNES